MSTSTTGLNDGAAGLAYGVGLQSQTAIGGPGLTNVTASSTGVTPTYYIYGF